MNKEKSLELDDNHCGGGKFFNLLEYSKAVFMSASDLCKRQNPSESGSIVQLDRGIKRQSLHGERITPVSERQPCGDLNSVL